MSLIKKILLIIFLNNLLLAVAPREFISARSYGLGQSFAAQKFDPASTLYNPAGIAGIEHLKLFAVQTNLLGEINYTGFSVARPFTKSVWGLSVINRSVNDIPLSSDTPSGWNIDFNNQEKMSFHSGVIAISYASILGKLSYGLNLKSFFASSNGYNQGNASGQNLDLGLLYQLHSDWAIGLSLRDILQSEIIWDTKATEAMSAAWILGIKTTALKRNLSVLVDLKSNYIKKENPLFAMGMEWHPINSLFFRFGLAQNILVPEFNQSDTKYYFNYSTGIGLNIAGLRFDYAYQLDQEVLDFSKHIFSLSYVGYEPADKLQQNKVSDNIASEEPLVPTVNFIVQQPIDRTVTISGQVKVIVKVENDNCVWINHEKCFKQDNDLVEKIIPLHVGLNDIIVSHEQSSNQPIKLKVLRMATFSDIRDSLYKLSIEQFATIGFIKEDFLDKFNPQRPLTRQEVSAIVTDIENIGIPLTLKGIWQDIDLLFNKGLIKGYPGGELLPNKKITRAEMAMILARLMDFNDSEFAQPSSIGQHWAFGAVSHLSNSGLFSMSEFMPWDGIINKEEAAELFTRLPQVEQKINNLMNFQEITYDQKQMPALLIRQQNDDEYQLFQDLLMNDKSENDLVEFSTFTETSQNFSGESAEIIIYEPIDKSIVYKDKIVVKGWVPQGAKAVLINGQKALINIDGTFQKSIQLTTIKNKIDIKVVMPEGIKIYKKRILKLKKVQDVATDHPVFKDLAAMITLGYLKTDSNFNFYPDKFLNRAEYAQMIDGCYCYNLSFPKLVNAPFKDVPISHPQASAIAAVSVKKRYIEGYGQFFKPNTLVSRAFGAVVIARAEGLNSVRTNLPYTDLSSDHWAAGSIAALINQGIIEPEKKFYPSNNLKKLTAVIWLSKTVQKQIDYLYNWEVGFN